MVFLWSTIIDANSLDSRPYVEDLPCDAASVRRRSIAVILLRGIRRCIAADRELNDDQSPISPQVEPVLGNLGDSLPQPLDFVCDKPLSVSDVSEARVLEAIETFKKEVNREQLSEKQGHRGSAGQRCHSGKEATTSGQGDRVADASEA